VKAMSTTSFPVSKYSNLLKILFEEILLAIGEEKLRQQLLQGLFVFKINTQVELFTLSKPRPIADSDESKHSDKGTHLFL
jgi:hypothetical protein